MPQRSLQFSQEARQRVNAAIAQAEARTSAEIVPVVARESGRYDRAEDLAGLTIAMLAFIGAWIALQDIQLGDWDELRLALPLVPLCLILVTGFVAGAFLASRVAWLRRLFVSRAEMHGEVSGRARQIMFDQRIHHTAARGGVLLYVSIFERQAVVLADEKATEALGESAIDELCKELTRRLSQGDIPAALVQTIQTLGERLAAPLPRQDTDANELPDALIVIG